MITEGNVTSVIMDDVFDLTLHATDVDGDALSWSISTPANHGTASVDDTPGLSKRLVMILLKVTLVMIVSLRW